MVMSRRVAIIVAMEREREPIVRSLPGNANDVVVVASGIGRKAVAAATRTIVDNFSPELLISAGLAGGLTDSLAPGKVLRPAVVIDSHSGEKYETVRDPEARGVLVTAATVLSREEKAAMASKFGADAVDMEAAVVAEFARASGIPFMAMKAISDPVDLEMPPMDRFIDPAGKLDLLKLLGYAALRPRTWVVALNELRKNSRKATDALARELNELVRPHIAR